MRLPTWLQVALAEVSQKTVGLADGDDHDVSLPHAWRLASFVQRAHAGDIFINVRGVRHPMRFFFSLDSVALYFHSNHSSARSGRPMPHNGARLDQLQNLSLLLNVTHTVDTQHDMYRQTYMQWYEQHGAAKQPSKATVDIWARNNEGIHNASTYGLDMRWFIKGPLHVVVRSLETFILLVGNYFHKLDKLDSW
tara:strand:+ start:2890 stop:3471 length:582 start_codon:yes stop_codon:yes gene_type:complete